jgi:hypothetical protein
MLAVPLQVTLAAALAGKDHALAQLVHERGHALAVALELVAGSVDVAFEASISISGQC